jgi:acyl-CoA dehydrogenase
LLLPDMPEEFGGGGGDFLHLVIVVEEIARCTASGVLGFTTHSGIVAPYLLHLGTDAQKSQWLPRMADGTLIAAIAMTEPSAGSDLKAIRTTAIKTEGGYRLNGQKTFITNGWNADRVLVVAKTDPEAGSKGMSLLWVDAKTAGFSRGNPLEKIGQHAQDTVELFFDDVMVPAQDLLGEENMAFSYLMSELVQERLMIAARCATVLESSLAMTIDYVKQRQAFGKRLMDQQHIRFRLAEIKTLACATRVFVDQCLIAHARGELTPEGAAMAKLWAADATRAVDDLLQFHGGYGYMRESAIARAYTDVRPNRIYGGSSEIMKEIISRSL